MKNDSQFILALFAYRTASRMKKCLLLSSIELSLNLRYTAVSHTPTKNAQNYHDNERIAFYCVIQWQMRQKSRARSSKEQESLKFIMQPKITRSHNAVNPQQTTFQMHGNLFFFSFSHFPLATMTMTTTTTGRHYNVPAMK